MDNVKIIKASSIGRGFIPQEYIELGQDEYYIRNLQVSKWAKKWRNLRAQELELLVKNGNYADNWDDILVTDEFDARQIRNTEFFGLVRIGRVQEAVLEHHDLQVPVGITNSRIISCDIGEDSAIHQVRYLAHYIIGNRVILANIDEMHTTNHSKFGNGIIKDGEAENVRVWLDLMNEVGSRKILPFDEIITADAYLWARYREDRSLQNKLKVLTQKKFDSRRGYYGKVGDECVIKNSSIIKDVEIGSCCYIKGANKLKNLTIKSMEAEPTQIGEGVELVNGIVGFGCHIFYGCKAVRFIMGNNSNLKYGARLLNSFLGDNATVSCCEILNNLIFPAHEQHHNNSFLVAALVQGQSNIAAGATIGSNHNSRANDNEIQAGRGFWPGLCVSLKHSCRFASFTLLAKADYPAELNISLPFSLLNNNTSLDQLEVMPAFWWLYNMYALARNSWKFRTRDKRRTKVQNIEFDFLAPDTVEEIIEARRLLEIWTAKAWMRSNGEEFEAKSDEEIRQIGQKLLHEPQAQTNELQVLGENMEKSKRKVAILQAYEGYNAYGQMLHYYGVKNLMDYLQSHPDTDFISICKALGGLREREWVNMGGQLIPGKDVDQLRADIGTGKLDSWDMIHRRYNTLWDNYPLAKQRHAFAVFCQLYQNAAVTKEQWDTALDAVMDIQELIRDRVYGSRKKDFENSFRKATYRNIEEMTAAIGTIEDDGFVKQVRTETEEFRKMIGEIKKRG
jgi:hypothetical protein